jgi:hypothetical protein
VISDGRNALDYYVYREIALNSSILNFRHRDVLTGACVMALTGMGLIQQLVCSAAAAVTHIARVAEEMLL